MKRRNTSDRKVSVGVVGCGLWGTAHIMAYRGLPHVQVSGVCDSSADRARDVAGAHGIPHWFDNYEELFALPGLEAVSVVTPEAEHLAPVIEAARCGLHVLVEKPVASHVPEIHQMIDAARTAGVILMPGHILRFETRYATVKEKLEIGELGRIVTVQARRNRTKETRRKYARAHPALVAAIHDIDVLLWYVQSPVKKVRGYHRNVSGLATPDVMWGIIEFENGVLGSIESTWLTPDAAGIPSDDILHVVTDRGIATIDFVHTGLALWKERGFEVPDVSIATALRGHLEGALSSELSYFAACVMNGEEPRVITAEEAIEAVRIASALVESAEKNREIHLSDGGSE